MPLISRWSFFLMPLAVLLLVGCPHRVVTILYPHEPVEGDLPGLSVEKNRETGYWSREAFNYRRDGLLLSVYGRVEDQDQPPAIELSVYIFNRGSRSRTLAVDLNEITVSGCQTERRSAWLTMNGGFVAQSIDEFTVGKRQAFLVFRFEPVRCPEVASRVERFTFDLGGVRVDSASASFRLPEMTFVTRG